MPPLTKIRCPWGDAAPKGSSRALWRQRSAPQGHPNPSPHPQLSLHSLGLYQVAGNEWGYPPATTDRETEAEEGPGPRSQSRRHSCGLILGIRLPPCHPHVHGPHHSPNRSACNPTPKSHAQGGSCFPSTATHPPPHPPSQAHPCLWCSLCSIAGYHSPALYCRDARCRGEARDAGSKGGGGTDNPLPQRGEVQGSQHP